MAKLQRKNAQEQVYVKQEQLINAGAFKADTAGAQALQNIGAVMTELGERKRAAQDSLAASEVAASQKLVNAQMKDFMVKNPDPNTWGKERERLLLQQRKAYSKSKMSNQKRAEMDVGQQSFTDNFRLQGEIAETTAIIDNDVTVTGSELSEAIAADDGSEIATANIEAAGVAHKEALLRKTTPELADISIKETVKQGLKGYWESQSKLPNNQDAVIKEMESKKKVLGKKGVDDDGLTAKDYDDVIGSAISAKNRAKQAGDEVKNEERRSLYEREDKGETLTRDDFNSAYPDADEADQNYDEYIAGQNAQASGEANYFKTGDPITIARVKAAIDLNPKSVTKEWLWSNVTNGIGSANISGLIKSLEDKLSGVYVQSDKYNSQFSTLMSAGYFGDKDEAKTSVNYLELKRKMTEYFETQKPTEADADKFFSGLIVKNYKIDWKFYGGGWAEKQGYKHTYTGADGKEYEGRFRYGDIRQTKDGDKVIEEYYAGTEDGEAIWIKRR